MDAAADRNADDDATGQPYPPTDSGEVESPRAAPWLPHRVPLRRTTPTVAPERITRTPRTVAEATAPVVVMTISERGDVWVAGDATRQQLVETLRRLAAEVTRLRAPVCTSIIISVPPQ